MAIAVVALILSTNYFFKKSIFLGTEVEDVASALYLLLGVFCLKVCVCTMCLLGAHGSGEGLGYPGAGISKFIELLGAAIWELGVQQGFSGREARVLVNEPSLQHSSLYSLKYLHLGKEYLLFTFSRHAKASLSYALQWFRIHTHLPGRLYQGITFRPIWRKQLKTTSMKNSISCDFKALFKKSKRAWRS